MNYIDKNVKKGITGGLISIVGIMIAAYAIKMLGMQDGNLPLLAGAVISVLLGLYDAMKHSVKKR